MKRCCEDERAGAGAGAEDGVGEGDAENVGIGPARKSPDRGSTRVSASEVKATATQASTTTVAPNAHRVKALRPTIPRDTSVNYFVFGTLLTAGEAVVAGTAPFWVARRLALVALPAAGVLYPYPPYPYP